MNIAVLDLGSNSFSLLVARVETGKLTKLDGHQHVVRLGQDMARTRLIGGAAWQRGMIAVEDLLGRVMRVPSCKVVAVATSAIREASNGALFARALEARYGLPVEVLSGAEEARLAYQGARKGTDARGSAVVLDVGGGSVEIAAGRDGEDCESSESLQLGVLRLKGALNLPPGPFSEDQLELATQVVRLVAAPATAAVRELAPETVIFSSGTARALANLARGGRSPTGSGVRLKQHEICSLAATLSRLEPKQIEALGVASARADTLAVGAVIIAELTKLLRAAEIEFSPWALREAVAFREYRRLEDQKSASRVA